MRLALGLCYLGQAYAGWQSQPSGHTVQDHLEHALARFMDVPREQVSTVCAGRTDAGVHGLMQVVHLDTPLQREPFSWVRGTNRFLPADIAVQWAQPVPETFHSRASAIARRYAYLVLESPVRPGIDAGRVGWVFRALDEGAMHAAAQHLLGEHDFTSFRASQCQARSPVKQLRRITITRRGAYWRFDFEADAFLHHMIRNIMGCLLQVGQGLHPPEWLAQVLQARSRDAAAPTFSPDGLYFLGPVYETHWGLPQRTAAYDWLP
ncbi:MAG: tRNA pseudouridine(38-40) synthase TruA [Betaproteobacteria bacterium]|nr:tRNA pseudouridine(38-40) synthase TruA [Betaproteobacteria bacterium]